MVKNPPPYAGHIGDEGFTPELGRSPGGGNGNPLQYSCLQNLMDRGAWQGHIVPSIAKSQTRLSTHTVLITDCLLITFTDIALHFIWQLCTNPTYSVPQIPSLPSCRVRSCSPEFLQGWQEPPSFPLCQ